MTDRVTALRRTLLDWGRTELRDLPWRRVRDPWAILVAETMCQQTQVARVVPRWEDFLGRWPTPAACAAAPRSAVLRAWQGLGYNRRAVALHETAQRVVAEHGGAVPVDRDALLDLPGVGPYTARAVRVFAHEEPDGVVDVNVGRVLARLVAGERLTPAAAQRLADDLVPDDEPWLWNQAVMELGATHCRKRAVDCAACPVAEHCAWRGQGPDPAVRTAGSGAPQSRFEGSDRQGRGRLLDALREGPVRAADAAAVTGWDDPLRVERVVDGLVTDGLVARSGALLRLPD